MHSIVTIAQPMLLMVFPNNLVIRPENSLNLGLSRLAHLLQ
jgi:hypothetical protein